VKALDAWVLLAILEGEPSAKRLLQHLRGVEVATTEVSMLELYLLADVGSARGRSARRASLERLRRKLTVLPIDSRAVTEAARRGSVRLRGEELLRLLEWGALEAYGCDELYTRSRILPPGKWRFNVNRVGAK